jgi:hypothetical protein
MRALPVDTPPWQKCGYSAAGSSACSEVATLTVDVTNAVVTT